MDVAIVNGRLYLEGQWENKNIYIDNEKIVAITDECMEAKETIDAQGLWVLPGCIDPHVHFDLQVGETCSRDDFRAGSILAAFGGVTTVIDFLKPINHPEELQHALMKRLVDAKESRVDYSFHTTISGYNGDIEELGEWTVKQGMPSIKLFTTYRSTDRQTKDRTIFELLLNSKAFGYRVLIHAENDGMIDESIGGLISEHEKRRPAISEMSEVIKLAQMTELANGLCYIVHTNCGSTVESLKRKYSELLENQSFIIESCPHYLLLDERVYHTEYGYRYVMTPPLRKVTEKLKLRSLFSSIHTIGTDHCPYTETEKKQATLDGLPNGIEGIPYTLPSLFKDFGEAVLPKITHESAKIHGLYPKKGVIKVGSDADIVLFDPHQDWTVTGDEPWYEILQRDITGSPYEGMPMKGRVLKTLLRGQKIMDQGKIYPSIGQFIKRGAVR